MEQKFKMNCCNSDTYNRMHISFTECIAKLMSFITGRIWHVNYMLFGYISRRLKHHIHAYSYIAILYTR